MTYWDGNKKKTLRSTSLESKLENLLPSPGIDPEKLNYAASKSGPLKKLSLETEFFLVFMKLPLDFLQTHLAYSLSNSNYFTSAKKCRRKSCIMDFRSAKMEFTLAIFKKLYFSKYSIKRCCKQITFIQKLVWPYKEVLNGVMITGRLSIT